MKVLLLIIMLLNMKFATAQDIEQPEIELIVTNLSSLIKSSKTEYEKSYLFIAQVKSFTTITGVSLLPAGKVIEVLLPKEACWEESRMAFTHNLAELTLSNLKLKKLIPAIASKTYEYFAILDMNKDKERTLAGCKLSKILKN